MASDKPAGYSTTQIMLHWSVATLVIFQFFINDGIKDAWHAYSRGEPTTQEQIAAANVHVIIGLSILALTLWRLVLRVRLGAPPAPDGEPRLLRIAAKATHHTLYLLLVLVPLSGAAAWFLGAEAASRGHGIMRTLLFIVACLHVVGALLQLVVFRSNVFMRMLATKD
jgi:cytochrome b561